MTASVEGTSTAKQGRTARYVAINDRYGTLELSVVTGKRVVRTTTYGYHVERVECDFGAAAFRLEKYAAQQVEGEENVYHVLLDLAPEGDHPSHSCECKGFLAHGHCKHLESLLALHRAGRLTCTATTTSSTASDQQKAEVA